MAKAKFDPNRLTFEDGLARIDKAIKKTGARLGGKIVTSRDSNMPKLKQALKVTNVPKGFQKYQLPVALRCQSQMFVTIAEPGIKTPRHAHKEGDGIRFIAGGSIIHEGKELTAGDWMFIPAGVPYSFEVGPQGALMCYCYCCCCA